MPHARTAPSSPGGVFMIAKTFSPSMGYSLSRSWERRAGAGPKGRQAAARPGINRANHANGARLSAGCDMPELTLFSYAHGMHKILLEARILLDMKYHSALAHHGTRRYPPPRTEMTPAPPGGTWHLPDGAWRFPPSATPVRAGWPLRWSAAAQVGHFHTRHTARGQPRWTIGVASERERPARVCRARRVVFAGC
jgi:hypothetical protein